VIEPSEGTPPGSVPLLYVEIGPSARQKSEQYKSDPEKHSPLNEYRYCIATVIFAFTYVDAYVNHLLHASPL
jgi:hypothetical protein